MDAFTYLPDPKNDRKVKAAPLPLFKPVQMELIFEDTTINLAKLRSVLEKEGRLKIDVCLRIIKSATEIMRKEANLLSIKEPACVVGDLHGQLYDLFKILDVGGNPADMKYSCSQIYILRRLCRQRIVFN